MMQTGDARNGFLSHHGVQSSTVNDGGSSRVLSNRMSVMEAGNTGNGILTDRSGMMQAWDAGSGLETVK